MATKAFTPRQRRLAKLLGIRLAPPKRILRYRSPVPDTHVLTHPLGGPPEWLSESRKKIWEDMLEYAPPGILATSDRPIVEITCSCLDNLSQGDPRAGELTLLGSCLNRMLFAPDRRRHLVMRYLPAAWLEDAEAVMNSTPHNSCARDPVALGCGNCTEDREQQLADPVRPPK